LLRRESRDNWDKYGGRNSWESHQGNKWGSSASISSKVSDWPWTARCWERRRCGIDTFYST